MNIVTVLCFHLSSGPTPLEHSKLFNFILPDLFDDVAAFQDL